MTSSISRRSIARHEAGHCLLAWMYAWPGSVRAILSSDFDDYTAGYTFHDLLSAAPWQRHAVTCAGPLASAIFAQQHGIALEIDESGVGAAVFSSQRQTLEGAGAQMGDDRETFYSPESLAAIEAGARPRSIEAQTLRLLRKHWTAVEGIAQALDRRGELSASDVTTICEAHGVKRLEIATYGNW